MKKIASEIAVGSDLELFLYDNELKKVVPCVDILEGTKEKPYVPEGVGEGFAIQEDNVMIEFNIPPAISRGMFYKYIRQGKQMVLKELNRRYGSKYSVYTRSHNHKFRAADLQSPQAKRIGCEPDFDAYNGGNMRVSPPPPGLTRSCGGHIHLGGDFKCPDFVAALFAELFLGLYGGISPQPNDLRVKWYGQPGIFRPKPYGIEYRTPNNNWFKTGSTTEIVGDYAIRCARYLTETDPVILQRAFRAIPWVRVREYMLTDKTTKASRALYMDISRAVKKAGVPL